MLKLWDSFSTLKESYYGIEINVNDLFANDNQKGCSEFIKNHFEEGCKSSALDAPTLWGYFDDRKCIHTVVLYLIGLVLRDEFKDEIKQKLDFIDDLDDWYKESDFLYTWFMTCLYHDAASCIEKNARRNNFKQRLRDLDKKYFRNKSFSSCQIVPKRYDEKTVRNYFKFQKKDANEQDHGIIGGCYLFDALIKNYEDHEQRCRSGQERADEAGLCWCESHKLHYAYVADAIITHNMWTVDKNTVPERAEVYSANGLEDLIVSGDEKKLSFKKYPLSFMLCLLDTIEPVKRFERLSPRAVLENVSIDSIGEKRIRIAWSDKIKREDEFWTWIKNISGMKTWMQVDVSECNREGNWCYVTIDF